ncbi:MAG TPA: prepilin-type N-terminal cleavage/methylation domain-containing protein [Patescibacteria group bacterium]|nr:prepilin-type N-terminal cleavage/methylation domain-containing protein [Patescibacteria group bacterium]
MKNTAQFRKGFTLIELLIVIALLGALAVGLLATIDPFEQLKKGRDTSTKNTVSEFYNAALRYYANKGVLPWGGTGLATATQLNTMTDAVNLLIGGGELKTGFMELAGTANLGQIFVNSTSADSIIVCYEPQSKSFQVDGYTQYNKDGSSPAQGYCKSDTSANASGGTSPCYFCVQ